MITFHDVKNKDQSITFTGDTISVGNKTYKLTVPAVNVILDILAMVARKDFPEASVNIGDFCFDVANVLDVEPRVLIFVGKDAADTFILLRVKDVLDRLKKA